MNIKKLFIDAWDEPTIFSYLLICISVIVLIGIGADLLLKRSCDNYEEITGRESKYISFDACYVKTVEHKWIRYDSGYKE